jgi:hypothetical protein
MALGTFDSHAVKQTRTLVGDAVRTRTNSSPSFPNPADFASEEEFCEALLDSLFGSDRN